MIDVLDLHTHTLASGHAYSTIREMAEAARKKGLAALGLTEHAPVMAGSCSALYFLNVIVHPRELSGVRLLFGAELNIINPEGEVDLTGYEVSRLDYTIASIHTILFQQGTTAEQNTDAYIRAMDAPKVKIIGHPDDGRVPVNMERLVRSAREKRVLLELNNSSLNPRSFRKDARGNDELMLRLCAEYGASIVINSDAHVAEDVGNHAFAHQLIGEVGFPQELIVNSSLEKFLSFIAE